MESREDTPNIALSGWTGVGTTTLTVILAQLLEKKLYPITQIFRHVDKILHQQENYKILKAEFEQEYQPIIGRTIDNYIDYLLLNKNNIILESDIAAFRVGKNPRVYSIFLIADKNVRKKRIELEGRDKSEAGTNERDKVLQEEYIKLWDIDIFDLNLIEKRYNLLIDNSELDLEEEVKIAIKGILDAPGFKNKYNEVDLLKDVPKFIKSYNKKGKKFALESLSKKGLLLEAQEMMQEIVATFPEDFSGFPEHIQQIFLGH